MRITCDVSDEEMKVRGRWYRYRQEKIIGIHEEELKTNGKN